MFSFFSKRQNSKLSLTCSSLLGVIPKKKKNPKCIASLKVNKYYHAVIISYLLTEPAKKKEVRKRKGKVKTRLRSKENLLNF